MEFSSSRNLPTYNGKSGVFNGSVVKMSPAEKRAESMAQEIDLVVGGDQRKLDRSLSRHLERVLAATR